MACRNDAVQQTGGAAQISERPPRWDMIAIAEKIWAKEADFDPDRFQDRENALAS
jgi:hypothetical protein